MNLSAPYRWYSAWGKIVFAMHSTDFSRAIRKSFTHATTGSASVAPAVGLATSIMTLCASWPVWLSTSLTASSHAVAQSGCGGTARYTEVLLQDCQSEHPGKQEFFGQPPVATISPTIAPAIA